jgi:hypothetical protein
MHCVLAEFGGILRGFVLLQGLAELSLEASGWG